MLRNLRKIFVKLNDSPSTQEGLFDFVEAGPLPQYEQRDLDFLTLYFNTNFSTTTLGDPLRTFFKLSENAFSAFIHAWMSELPVEREIVNFARKIMAADECDGGKEEKRAAAEKAACDRTDENTLVVLDAEYKVKREIDRMRGLLRFFPENETYVARCAPDHLILPALGDYFTARFGETDWTIIDEKRCLYISRRNAGEARTYLLNKPLAAMQTGDEWEDLWRHYHSTINNESRNNPNLQRQFMPKRYWKYLPEM